MQGQKYALYVDETGSSKPSIEDKFPYFGLGGIIISPDKEPEIVNAIQGFKCSWNIRKDIAFHGSEIRSKKGNFRWLNQLSIEETKTFKNGLAKLLIDLPILIHACIINRRGYLTRYRKQYGRNTWEMRKSAAAILFERSAKYVEIKGGNSLEIFCEKGQSEENRIVSETYKQLIATGHPFDKTIASKYQPADPERLKKILITPPQFMRKDSELMQIADLVIFYIAHGRDSKRNHIFQKFLETNRLVDCLLDGRAADTGIKYYCFDD